MTLLASQLLLSRKDVAHLRLYDAYALHRVVYSLFEDVRRGSDNPNASAGFLYADAGQVGESRRVLLLSNRPPRRRVSDRYGEVASKPISPGFLQHNRYRFQIVANPVVERSGRREPVRKVEDIKKWFDKRSSSWGFLVDPDVLEASVPHVQRIKTPAGQSLAVSQSTIKGILKVSDRELFTQAFSSGIGRARAFGCGLLQVKPILSPSNPESSP